mmetsp:Transcript_32843/g.73130  ORF Transcript_32843/g.73130 Transcript_32843/m.73130 type:complete len:226 (+) Transcript_32843:121-798(+)
MYYCTYYVYSTYYTSVRTPIMALVIAVNQFILQRRGRLHDLPGEPQCCAHGVSAERGGVVALPACALCRLYGRFQHRHQVLLYHLGHGECASLCLCLHARLREQFAQAAPGPAPDGLQKDVVYLRSTYECFSIHLHRHLTTPTRHVALSGPRLAVPPLSALSAHKRVSLLIQLIQDSPVHPAQCLTQHREYLGPAACVVSQLLEHRCHVSGSDALGGFHYILYVV